MSKQEILDRIRLARRRKVRAEREYIRAVVAGFHEGLTYQEMGDAAKVDRSVMWRIVRGRK